MRYGSLAGVLVRIDIVQVNCMTIIQLAIVSLVNLYSP